MRAGVGARGGGGDRESHAPLRPLRRHCQLRQPVRPAPWRACHLSSVTRLSNCRVRTSSDLVLTPGFCSRRIALCGCPPRHATIFLVTLSTSPAGAVPLSLTHTDTHTIHTHTRTHTICTHTRTHTRTYTHMPRYDLFGDTVNFASR